MTNGNGSDPEKDLREAALDLVTYPILTDNVTFPSSQTPSGPSGGGSLKQVVDASLRDVLGWRTKPGDPKGFTAALTQAFDLKQVEGHVEWTWTPRSYSVQPDMGALTGAQASIYQRAKAALDQCLPLLDGLYPLDVSADPQDMEAMRAIVRSELVELVTELGTTGGPRVQRVDTIFKLLTGYSYQEKNPPKPIKPDKAQGQLGVLRDRFGLQRIRVNYLDEEQNLTNFYVIVNYVDTLLQSWVAERHYFNRVGSDVFLGTQLVLLSRQLSVISESVQEAYMAMDSVFVGPAERQTTYVTLAEPDSPKLTIAEILEWVDHFSSEEGPKLIQDSGKDGVIAFLPTMNQLTSLITELQKLSATRSNNPTPGFHTPRVYKQLDTLKQQMAYAHKLAQEVKRTPAPEVDQVDPAEACNGDKLRLIVDGNYFQAGALLRFYRHEANKGGHPSTTQQQVIDLPNCKFISSTEVAISLDLTDDAGRVPDLPVGVWRVVVENPDGSTSSNTRDTPTFTVLTYRGKSSQSSKQNTPQNQSTNQPKIVQVVVGPTLNNPDARTLTIKGEGLNGQPVVQLRFRDTTIAARTPTYKAGVITAEFDLTTISDKSLKGWNVIVINQYGKVGEKQTTHQL